MKTIVIQHNKKTHERALVGFLVISPTIYSPPPYPSCIFELTYYNNKRIMIFTKVKRYL